MRRRDFIKAVAGSAATWPEVTRAQQTERMRSIGMLHTPAADDPEGQVRNAAFLQGLEQFGWTEGGNVRIETRWAAGDADRIRKSVAELVMLAPDVIVTTGSATVGPLMQATRNVPIVFVGTPDPVGAGLSLGKTLASCRGTT
jgi:putative ABC transport system substrate-binding protein